MTDFCHYTYTNWLQFHEFSMDFGPTLVRYDAITTESVSKIFKLQFKGEHNNSTIIIIIIMSVLQDLHQDLQTYGRTLQQQHRDTHVYVRHHPLPSLP